MKSKLEMILLNDGSVVIAGAHLTAEEAETQFGDEFRNTYDPNEKIDFVRHSWLRYEMVGEDRADDELDYNYRVWFLYEQKERPKGVVRKATVIR